MHQNKNPFGVKILLSYEELERDTAAARSVRHLQTDLADDDTEIIVAEHLEDARAIFASDAGIQCVLMGLECQYCSNTYEVLDVLRSQNPTVPIFLMSSRNMASQIPTSALEKVSDFIWLSMLEPP